jgi:aryl-alcohol dehydrogenase-like predicted oxidoreductase
VSSPHFSVLDWVRPPWPGCVSISGPNQLAARKFYQNSQIPILAWSPLASGFVSLPVNEARKSKTLGVYGSPANFARKKKLEWLARKYDRTVSQIALAYLFSQPFPVSAVVFTSRAENIKSNLAATAIKLLPAELTLLEQIEIAKIFD